MRPLRILVALLSLHVCRVCASVVQCGPSRLCLTPPTAADVEVVGIEGVAGPQGYFHYSVQDSKSNCSCEQPVRPPIAKCCDDGKAIEEMACVETEVLFQPVLIGPWGNLTLVDYENVNLIPCDKLVPINNADIVEITLGGELRTNITGAHTVKAGHFCLENSLDGVGSQMVAICWDGREPGLQPKFLIFGSIMLASSPFLLATALVHLILPQLRNLHAWIVSSHTCSLFMAYLSLSSAQIFSQHFSDTSCTVVAFIIYFSFLASFFWLNVMCFDIFWTFSGFRSLRGTAREREHKKFIIYSIYSWGCPLIMLSVTLIMQFHEDIPEGLLRPQFGVQKCWFPEDKITTLAYFYGPVGVLVLCNIILFILTAVRISQLKRETAMLKGADSRRHDDDNRQRFNLYLKLFLVMGVNWSMEVISWVAGGPEYVWYATDICNTLQGVLIFVIFVWKDRIRRMLMEKFCPKRSSTKLSKSTAVTYSTRASPSRLSHGMLNNKVADNSNGEVVKITAITHLSDDSDVP